MLFKRKKPQPEQRPVAVEASRVCAVCGSLLFDHEQDRCDRHAGAVFGSRYDAVRGETETRS